MKTSYILKYEKHSHRFKKLNNQIYKAQQVDNYV